MPRKQEEQPIRFDGSDSDFFYFSTASWAVKNVRYGIHVCKRTGFIFCECQDSFFRHKHPSLVPFLERKPSERACKHQRLLRGCYFDLLEVG